MHNCVHNLAYCNQLGSAPWLLLWNYRWRNSLTLPNLRIERTCDQVVPTVPSTVESSDLCHTISILPDNPTLTKSISTRQLRGDSTLTLTLTNCVLNRVPPLNTVWHTYRRLPGYPETRVVIMSGFLGTNICLGEFKMILASVYRVKLRVGWVLE